ncbi:MAG TPA: hypothetical protein DCM08_08975 [Microscillaceae bacterium]|jgi:ABC-2 type transport system permease protein|nr:hypothetical protein [Microscillaceae bacterium]
MRTLLVMLWFEWLNLFRNRLVIVLAVLLLGSAYFAAYNGSKRVQKQQIILQKVKQTENTWYAENKQRLDSIEKGLRQVPKEWYKDPTNPLVLGAVRGAGKYAVLPPKPMGLLSTGQSDIFPFYSKVSFFAENAAQDNENFENPFNTALGEFDLAFVLVFLLPLLIISLGYDVFSAEREQGTLRLVMAMPVQLTKWLFQKILFRYLLLSLLATIILAAVLLSFAISPFSLSFVYLIISTLLYTLFWFSAAFIVNLWQRSSAFNAAALLSLWIFFAIIAPGTVNLMAFTLYPVPSRVVYVNANRAIDQQLEQQEQTIVANFYAKNPQFKQPAEGSPKTWRERFVETIALREYKIQQQAKLDSSFQQKINQQRQFANRLQWSSPAIVFQQYLNQLAGTDTQTYLLFQAQVADFQRRWEAYFKDKFISQKPITTQDFAQFPQF